MVNILMSNEVHHGDLAVSTSVPSLYGDAESAGVFRQSQATYTLHVYPWSQPCSSLPQLIQYLCCLPTNHHGGSSTMNE